MRKQNLIALFIASVIVSFTVSFIVSFIVSMPGCAADFDPASYLANVRVLAVKAEPPELLPERLRR